jgi:hypothetical protein
MSTHSTKLMHTGECSDRRVVSDINVPSQGSSVGKNDVIPYVAIVSDMNTRHQEISTSEYRLATPSRGSSIDGNEFSDDVVITNLEKGLLASILEVLRIGTDGAVAVEPVISADFGRALDDSERPHRAIFPDDNMVSNNGIRTHRCTISQCCLG